jgi:hypothetical protein
VLGYGAQNSFTTTCTRANIDILPKATNVTVAIYRVIASTMTNNPPTNVPTQADLKSYLDGLYGKQANIFFKVLPATNIVVNYDLNGNGSLNLTTSGITAEGAAITNAASIGSSPSVINLYYVNALAVSNTIGLINGIAYPTLRVTFIRDVETNLIANVTAHEIGHQLGLQGHVPIEWRGNDDRLMWWISLTTAPCRLIQREWRTVNQSAQ